MRQGHNPTIRDAKSHAFIHCKVVDEISHHLHVRYHTVEWALLSVSPWCRHLVTVPTAPRRCTISATSSAATRTSPASWARWASTSRNWTHPTPEAQCPSEDTRIRLQLLPAEPTGPGLLSRRSRRCWCAIVIAAEGTPVAARSCVKPSDFFGVY